VTLRTENCGCEKPPRRICDLCYSADSVFLACSLACLERHQEGAHADIPIASSEERARAAARAYNRRFPDSWARYAAHRQRVMELIAELPRGAEICVLGAGNCSDLDLETLAESYREIHLVDLDGEALERSRDRQASGVRDKIVLHPDVDFSGLLSKLDAWGEQFPQPTELGQAAVAAAQRIVRELGQTFAVTVSTCVLSQLAVPYQHAWVTARPNWANLLSALTAVHLATLAASTSRGGHALLVCDTSSSKDTPELAEQRGRTSAELAHFVESRTADGSLVLRPAPRDLLLQLSSPGLKSLVSEPVVHSPWLWDLGDATQLVYAIGFSHP
jgi:hypothetical protein